MSDAKLEVTIRVHPPKDVLSKAEIDELMDGEISGFERHIKWAQEQRGLAPDPLSTPERGIIKAYLLYAGSRPEK